MGRGDKKTAKGKRFKGSYGVSRRKKTNTIAYVAKPKKTKVNSETETATKKTTKKPTAKKTTKKTTSKK